MSSSEAFVAMTLACVEFIVSMEGSFARSFAFLLSELPFNWLVTAAGYALGDGVCCDYLEPLFSDATPAFFSSRAAVAFLEPSIASNFASLNLNCL